MLNRTTETFSWEKLLEIRNIVSSYTYSTRIYLIFFIISFQIIETMHIWRPWRFSKFQDHPPSPPTPFHLRPKFFHLPWLWTFNFKRTIPTPTHTHTLSNKLWNNSHTVHVKERNQNKNKTKSRHIQIDHK